MKKIYLFPGYVSLDSAEEHSPSLFAFLRQKGIEFKRIRWNGEIPDLPTNEKVIVRASTMLSTGEDWKELGAFCARHGHLCFYDDELIDGEGQRQSIDDLTRAAEQFLN